MLRAEGLVLTRRRSYCIYREDGLSLKRRKPGKIRRRRFSLPLPTEPGQRWSMDFVNDPLAYGRRFRVLNKLDGFTQKCVLQLLDTRITGAREVRELSPCTLALPAEIVYDNRPEFTCKEMFQLAQEHRVALCFIEAGLPKQNAFVESFNGKLRENCRDQHWFADLAEARLAIEAWRIHYNTVRPHSSLGRRPPSRYAQQADSCTRLAASCIVISASCVGTNPGGMSSL